VATVDDKREVRAEARYVRVSPRKARLVVEHLPGLTVPEARTVLAFTPRAAAREVDKVLRSAVANAEANHGLSGDDLVVSSAYVDSGPVLKRWRARARGRVARIRKRTCHITLKLTEGAAPAARPARRARAAQPEATEAAPSTEERAKRTRPPRAATTKASMTTKEKPKRAPRRKKEAAS
jgi:large subunit ribosomal protein L22